METEEKINTNMDDPMRHNIGGAMNRPPRSLDPMISDRAQKEISFDESVTHILNDIGEMLVEKNRKYGNSALEPKRIFSKASAIEQLLVRIDDKLSRISENQIDDSEDSIKDLIGYLILLKIAIRKV
jgi:hypothetical protein